MRLAELHPQYPAKDVELSVNVILDAISDTISRGGRIEIRGFGSFVLKYRAPRTGKTQNQVKKCKCPQNTDFISSRGWSYGSGLFFQSVSDGLLLNLNFSEYLVSFLE
jgi:nucleoid DNA-binding protein